MKSNHRHLGLTSLVCLACLAPSPPLMAQGVGQLPPLELHRIRIVGERLEGTETSPQPEQAREELEKIPGGVGLVTSEQFDGRFVQSLGDTLQLTPGVFADTSSPRHQQIERLSFQLLHKWNFLRPLGRQWQHGIIAGFILLALGGLAFLGVALRQRKRPA